MPGPQPTPIELTERQRKTLAKIVARETSAQRLVRRSRIILAIAAGGNNSQVADRLGIHYEQVRAWRQRWLKAAPGLTAVEDEGRERELTERVEAALSDAPRPGAPAKFSPVQVAQIHAVACERPEEESSRPVSHWTPRELRDEVIERGIIEDISVRTVGRFLKRGHSSPTEWTTG